MLLSIECSATPVSVSISDGDKIIASDFSSKKVTHSETLMPMVADLLKKSDLTLNDIDEFAVAYGPGSFTGIRIGISAVKGLAAPQNKPCYGVSTLAAMAYFNKSFDGVICPVMDARCNQVYNALFKCSDGIVTRITDDRALMCNQLADELSGYTENILICGDGTEVFGKHIKNSPNITLLNGDERYQNAVGVAYAAKMSGITPVAPNELLPVYLRLPQAERELNKKKGM